MKSRLPTTSVILWYLAYHVDTCEVWAIAIFRYRLASSTFYQDADRKCNTLIFLSLQHSTSFVLKNSSGHYCIAPASPFDQFLAYFVIAFTVCFELQILCFADWNSSYHSVTWRLWNLNNQNEHHYRVNHFRFLQRYLIYFYQNYWIFYPLVNEIIQL